MRGPQSGVNLNTKYLVNDTQTEPGSFSRTASPNKLKFILGPVCEWFFKFLVYQRLQKQHHATSKRSHRELFSLECSMIRKKGNKRFCFPISSCKSVNKREPKTWKLIFILRLIIQLFSRSCILPTAFRRNSSPFVRLECTCTYKKTSAWWSIHGRTILDSWILKKMVPSE